MLQLFFYDEKDETSTIKKLKGSKLLNLFQNDLKIVSGIYFDFKRLNLTKQHPKQKIYNFNFNFIEWLKLASIGIKPNNEKDYQIIDLLGLFDLLKI